MKKYGGGSYFPSGAPGREERREEDYPQGEKICNLLIAAPHIGAESMS